MNRNVRHVILDRDGVLNAEPPDGGYISEPSQFHWLPGSLDALRALKSRRIRVTIATNQSGIGRGLLSRDQLQRIQQKMDEDAAGAIRAHFVCPHAPEANCDCRKPRAQLIFRAIESSGVPSAQTLLVGDDMRDLLAARHAGIKAILVRTGKGRSHEQSARNQGVEVFDDLRAVVESLSVQEAQINVPRLAQHLDDHLETVKRSRTSLVEPLEKAARLIIDSMSAGGKLIACGNGGSAADADHFVAEIVGRFSYDRRALPAVALGGSPASLTAIANDYGYAHVFRRQVAALARPGDVLIAISTSGRSENVVNAAREAHAQGCWVVALTGESDSPLSACADFTLRAPSTNVAHIQEIHAICLHALARVIEEALVVNV